MHLNIFKKYEYIIFFLSKSESVKLWLYLNVNV